MSGANTAIIFDLDGTLIDSVGAIMKVGDAMLAELSLAPLTLAEARSYIGNGAAKFVERALAARAVDDAAKAQTAYHRFEALYAEADPRENTPFPGVDDALRAFAAQGYALGLCTNKPGAPTRNVVEAMGWSDLFGVVIAGDSLDAKKPDPAPLRAAAERLDRPRTVYVGDSEVDAETAQRAGLPFLLFTEGYRKAPIADLPHHAAFSRFDALPARLRELAEAA